MRHPTSLIPSVQTLAVLYWFAVSPAKRHSSLISYIVSLFHSTLCCSNSKIFLEHRKYTLCSFLYTSSNGLSTIPAVRCLGSWGLQRSWHSEAARRVPSQLSKMSWNLRREFWRWRVFGILISSSVSTAISFKIKKKKRPLSSHLPPSLCHNSDSYTTKTTQGCLQGFSFLFCVQLLLPFRVISFPIFLTPNINEFQVKVCRTFPVAKCFPTTDDLFRLGLKITDHTL